MKPIKYVSLVLFFTLLTTFAFAEGVLDFNGGEALKSLANNNAVIGILYSLVFVEATIIAFLWRRLDKLNDKLLKSFEDRLEREENLYSQINRLNTEIELIKQTKKK